MEGDPGLEHGAWGLGGENLQNSQTGAAVAFWGQAVQQGLGRYSIQ